MKEFLIKKDENGYFCENEKAAIERLGRIEALYQRLQTQQEEISAELSQLRAAGKTKSVRFNQLLTKKLNNVNIIAALESCF
ncbi:MAG: hypothetical protein ACI4W6_05515 [Acutalibacteraceae bacterium]